MKKRTLYILIGLMTISLIGIIWIQVYWIHNGILVKEAQFNQLVTEALNHVIDDVENDESIDFIHHQLAQATSKIVIETDSIDDSHLNKIRKWTSKHRIVNDNDSIHSFDYSFSTNSDNNEDVTMEISVNGNKQTIDIKKKAEELENLFSEDSLMLPDSEDMVFTNRFGNIMVKMIKEFKNIDQPIQHLLHNANLNEIIESNLADNGIHIPFTYAVMHGDSIVDDFSSENFVLSANSFKVNLFKNRLFDKSAQLAINFEGKRHYILKSMWVMLSISALFTLIIILTFGGTLYYMLRQKKLSEMKNDFISNMTHEFKTPISTISLAVDSITHPKIIGDKNQINHYADIIRKENQRMNKQVENVLNTALGEKGELEFHKSELDLNELIKKIPDRMKLQLEANNAELKLKLCNDPLMAFVDEMHVQNAICNLIDNAIKYNQNAPLIIISTKHNNGFCEINVTDNGIGMNSETQKKVFDKFYRVQKGNIHTIKGFGIGLSYVKAIVNAHKGLISLKSKLSEGTTITINIPEKN